MKTINIFLAFIIILVVIFISCNDTSTNSTPNLDEYILKTDKWGNILGGDYSDWCLHSVTYNYFEFGPAYPNPSSDTFTVPFQFTTHDMLFTPDTVTLYLLTDNMDTVFFLKNNRFGPGYYSLRVIITPELNYHKTLRRLYLKCRSYQPGDSCKNYGDIYIN